jgi:hypothetical protein
MITLLTSLPLRGSARTTEVVRLGGADESAAKSAAPANKPPIHIVEQRRMKMFSVVVQLNRLGVANSNGIISL